jgi:ABC-type transport system involved in multi-copper enzyme maturation permease subunit
MNWWIISIMTIIAVVGPTLLAFMQTVAFDSSKKAPEPKLNIVWDSVGSFTQFYMLFAIILVIMMVVQEYQFGTMQIALITHANRVTYFLSKLTFAGLVTAVTYGFTTFIGFIGAYIGQRGMLTKQSFFELFTEYAGLIYGRALLAVLLTTVIMVGLSFLFKSSMATILTYCFVFFVLNNILLLALNQTLGDATGPNLMYWLVAFAPAMCLDVLMQGTFSGSMHVLSPITGALNMPITQDQYLIITAIVYAVMALISVTIALIMFKKQNI